MLTYSTIRCRSNVQEHTHRNIHTQEHTRKRYLVSGSRTKSWIHAESCVACVWLSDLEGDLLSHDRLELPPPHNPLQRRAGHVDGWAGERERRGERDGRGERHGSGVWPIPASPSSLIFRSMLYASAVVMIPRYVSAELLLWKSPGVSSLRRLSQAAHLQHSKLVGAGGCMATAAVVSIAKSAG